MIDYRQLFAGGSFFLVGTPFAPRWADPQAKHACKLGMPEPTNRTTPKAHPTAPQVGCENVSTDAPYGDSDPNHPVIFCSAPSSAYVSRRVGG